MIFTGKFKSRDHALDHRRLLKILCAKNRDVRQHDVEQLGNDCRDTPKMRGPRCAFHRL